MRYLNAFNVRLIRTAIQIYSISLLFTLLLSEFINKESAISVVVDYFTFLVVRLCTMFNRSVMRQAIVKSHACSSLHENNGRQIGSFFWLFETLALRRTLNRSAIERQLVNLALMLT